MRISDWSSDVCSSDLPDRLKALGVTAGEISNQLRSMQQEAPGGRSDLNGLVQSVRTLGTVSSAAELAQVSLPLPDGRRPRLADRSEERRVGQECVSTCRSRWSTHHTKNKNKEIKSR